MKMKKILSGVLAVLMLAGCASAEMSGEITVMSREDGSGTRGAFVELTGVEQKNAGVFYKSLGYQYIKTSYNFRKMF